MGGRGRGRREGERDRVDHWGGPAFDTIFVSLVSVVVVVGGGGGGGLIGNRNEKGKERRGGKRRKTNKLRVDSAGQFSEEAIIK